MTKVDCSTVTTCVTTSITVLRQSSAMAYHFRDRENSRRNSCKRRCWGHYRCRSRYGLCRGHCDNRLSSRCHGHRCDRRCCRHGALADTKARTGAAVANRSAASRCVRWNRSGADNAGRRGLASNTSRRRCLAIHRNNSLSIRRHGSCERFDFLQLSLATAVHLSLGDRHTMSVRVATEVNSSV